MRIIDTFEILPAGQCDGGIETTSDWSLVFFVSLIER